uniref:ZP domain-containing protein n=2 Tax=Musca domestica TaxID=7370 RepID=A0A1I8N601_MUSDO
MEVRQNGQLIDRMVNVIPGTPLIMEIKLNNESSQVYGIHVQYLEVSDGNSTSETILFRGCTVDPYLFDNFLMTPANTLQAKFRAFKFPNTPYVQFRANVRICLRKCLIPHCLNGQGRSRRELNGEDEHLYEISLGVIMKIDDKFTGNNDELRKLESHVKELKNKNRILRDK